jgi:gamma-glutamylcyclotransferase (GGCT)/AIG2-like uncharacterized protein YtfP
MTKVFVYGTLRAGGALHAHMKGADLVCSAGAVRGYAMFDLGFYPAVEATWVRTALVVGEVYEVDAAHLARLDQVEGVPHLYQRTLVDVVVGGGSDGEDTVEAFIYTMQQGQANGDYVLGGNWMRHIEGRVAL